MENKIITSENEKNQAIQYAITDIGLTESEAEQAFNDFYPRNDNDYCDTCGKILIDYGENKNCNNSYDDDFCDKCHQEYINNFEKITGCKWDSIQV